MKQLLRVLVVDDYPDLRATLRILLGLWGHDVEEAADGPTALERAAVFQPDVVLLDLHLPELNGYEVARRLRQLPGLEEVRLIAITGYGDAQTRAACQAVGFEHYLLKPFDPDELERLLRPRA